MSYAMVLGCDDTWDDGRMPCRGALPHVLTEGIDNRPALHERADRAGWTLGSDGLHRCPAHTRRAAADGATVVARRERAAGFHDTTRYRLDPLGTLD